MSCREEVSENNCSYIEALYSDCTLCPLYPDLCSEQAPPGADGRSDSQSFPYLQRLNHPATAVKGTYKW